MHGKIKKRRDALLGKEFETNKCGKCFIIDYKGKTDVTVMFYDPIYVTKVSLGNLKSGKAVNKLARTVYGVGYIGVGQYSKLADERCYTVWSDMLLRAYCDKFIERNQTYKNVTVCEEWQNFQNFAMWYYNQMYHSGVDDSGCSYHLDKDILLKGNKVYSPNTCCFVPPQINSLLIKNDARRGELPLGVSYDKERFVFKSVLNIESKQKFLGRFDTVEEAFAKYKESKEKHIKTVAEKWKDLIDCRAYEALMQYKVEITD